MIAVNFSVRLNQDERSHLQRLADQSGRTPGEVVRRLLALTNDLPEARRALGLWDEQPKKAQEVEA